MIIKNTVVKIQNLVVNQESRLVKSNPEYVLEKPQLLPILMKNLHTKCCTNNYLISHVKRVTSLAICSGSSAFNFRKKILNQKYGDKNSDFDLFPLLFILLTFSSLYCSCKFLKLYRPFLMVLACFRWFQIFLDGFSSFQILLDRFRSFQLVLRCFSSSLTLHNQRSESLYKQKCS